MAITYGYLCEDVALELFIDNVLIQIGPTLKCKAFNKDKNFCDSIKPTSGKNRTEIIKQYKDAAKKAISISSLDLFITAYDFDDANIDGYDAILKKQIDDIVGKARNRTVMCVPVKCIEYWLWYVKYGADTNKSVGLPLETNIEFNRHVAKSNVYERELDEKGKYPGRSTTYESAKALEILKNLNIDKLATCSPSFKHFIVQLKTFCNTFA